jgi:hypothetical protein
MEPLAEVEEPLVVLEVEEQLVALEVEEPLAEQLVALVEEARPKMVAEQRTRAQLMMMMMTHRRQDYGYSLEAF